MSLFTGIHGLEKCWQHTHIKKELVSKFQFYIQRQFLFQKTENVLGKICLQDNQIFAGFADWTLKSEFW